MNACKHCGKLFKNVEEHITKTHLHNTITFRTVEASKYSEEYKCMDTFCYDGLILKEWNIVASCGDYKVGFCLSPASELSPGSPEEAFSRKHKVPKKGTTMLYVEHDKERSVVLRVYIHNQATDKVKELYIHNVHA